MVETEYERSLSQLAELVGGGISGLNFKITLSDGMELGVADCAMHCTRTLHEWVFEGHWQHARITWIFTRAGSGWLVHLQAKGDSMPHISSYFHQEGMGPYDAIRELFRIIRGCVGSESHIIGCSLPEECGSGVADSGRTGIDIHNQWTHVEWVVDSLLHNYWLQGRVWINDPDFLIVRGSDTSLEKETNVMNPRRFNPNPQGFTKRWRQGPVFQYDEARTWTNLVILTGGSVFLSDRIAMLNRKALELIYLALEPSGAAAEPLDLADEARPSFWLQKLPDGNRLGLINWSKEEVTVTFDFERFGLPVPDVISDFWGEREIVTEQSRIHFVLKGHASALLSYHALKYLSCILVG